MRLKNLNVTLPAGNVILYMSFKTVRIQITPVNNVSHPQERMRRPCDTTLLKTVELGSQRIILYPYRVYCYLSIEKSLLSLLSKPSFVVNCEKWRRRAVLPNTLCDIYDGMNF